MSNLLTKSASYNPNYMSKVIRLENLQKHVNADRLQTASIDFQTVITGMQANNGDLVVYFPVESQITDSFIASINSFRKPELNDDKKTKGFFEATARVKALKLRGEKSMGFIVPFEEVLDWAGLTIDQIDIEEILNEDFDTVNNKLLVKKYISVAQQEAANREAKQKKKQTPKVNRLIDGQVQLHVDTNNLRKEVRYVQPLDNISITYKLHGTSFWLSNVLVKRQLSFKDKVARFFGATVQETEYDLVYGSRKVVKNRHFDDPKNHNNGYYKVDVWSEIADKIGHLVPKGYSFYGEAVGYLSNGGQIQKGYDYGCEPNEFKLFIYRIKYTNADGFSRELTTQEIIDFCKPLGLETPPLKYIGPAGDFANLVANTTDVSEWREKLIQTLEERYNDHDCYMCNNKVPEEGIVLRIENSNSFKAKKLKSFSFLEYETKQLDEEEK